MYRPLLIAVTGFLLLNVNLFEARSAELDSDEASAALRKAVDFFRTEVSTDGGYVWRYSGDLEFREGEGKVGPTTAWVQPPGTPSVGGAYLTAYELTGDRNYLEAARETAEALVAGRLVSGGWDYRIEFDSQARKRYAYRVDGVDQSSRRRNTTTLDDNTTQAALRFLMRVDRALNGEHEGIHEAAQYALNALLEAQYPNGAWPQRFDEPPDDDDYPVKAAGYPDTWSRTHPDADYRGYYTFNDNTIADMIETMFEAAELYHDDRYRATAERAGDFILLAQMPEPQPAWAQQYNRDMQPAWARRFEPASITGGESQGVLRVLLELYERTGEEKYLEPIPRAVEYLRSCCLPDGRLARFYELQTNRPLYFTKKYELTYEADDLPTHYGFLVSSKLDAIEAEYRRLRSQGPSARDSADANRRRVKMTPRLAKEARAAVESLDDRGAWVERGRLKYHDEDTATRIIDSRTFAQNVEVLSRYISALR